MIITIDGPAGTGKTTIARRIAERLGMDYFDTGAMYRVLTYRILEEKIDYKNEQALTALLAHFHFDSRKINQEIHYFVNEEDLTASIRSEEVTKKVSEIASYKAVRQSLLTIQRDYVKGRSVVFEGRDMGTVVFPNADVKFFLTARPAIRAERRYLELKDKKNEISEQEVREAILARDHHDSNREISPLRQAEDAYLIDTSELTIDQVIDQLLAKIPRQ